MSQKKIINMFAEILTDFEFDLNDPNFVDTPRRMAGVLSELLYGHTKKGKTELVNCLSKTFPTTNNEMIVVRRIHAIGLCPHHFLPVIYNVSVGYIPKNAVIGLSKLPRIVKILAKQAIIQEDLTNVIADLLFDELQPEGVAVYMNGKHSCAQIRGVQEINLEMITSALRGCMNNAKTKAEFFELIKL